jgi:hypothetical protein
VRTFHARSAAERTAKRLCGAGLSAWVQHPGEDYVVLVADGQESAASDVLGRRPESSQSVPGVVERIFNVEHLLTAVFVAGAASLALFAIGVIVLLTKDLGWLGLVVVVIAGLAYFHFSGRHSAVSRPDRLSSRAGPLIQNEMQDHNYRRAWLMQHFRRPREWPDEDPPDGASASGRDR